MVWQYIYSSILLKKGLLLTAIQIWGTAETRRCDADAVRLQVITQNAPLTLRASYLPLPPPPSSAPCSHSRPLSPFSLIQHRVHRGVSTQLPLIKIIGTSICNWPSFTLLFLCCFTPVHFSQHPLPKNCISFFPLIINPKILFPLFSLSQFLLFLNKYANYSYRRIWNLPVNPAQHVPGFMEEKCR